MVKIFEVSYCRCRHRHSPNKLKEKGFPNQKIFHVVIFTISYFLGKLKVHFFNDKGQNSFAWSGLVFKTTIFLKKKLGPIEN